MSTRLAERILMQEHLAYSEAIALVATGNYRIEGRRVLGVRATGSSETSL